MTSLFKDLKDVGLNGLWRNNIVFGQLLALCPLLAVTGTATNGLGMGLATLVVLLASGVIVSAMRNVIPNDVRIPSFVLIIASLVTVVDMVINAWAHELYKVLGLFIPLIVTNCAILGRAEAYASKKPVGMAAFDGLMMGLGFTAVLVVLGAVREIIGSGTLFANAALLLGPSFSFMEMTLIPNYQGFLIVILPPGGFIILGLLLGLKNVLDERASTRLPKDIATGIPKHVFTAAGALEPKE